MSSPDYQTFVASLAPDHEAWLTGNPSLRTSPDRGTLFFNHYVGDPTNPSGLLWRYENWRSEHGYTRVRPWNGAEDLRPAGSPSTPEIPSPGTVLPWLTSPIDAPTLDPRLTWDRTSVQLQGDFGVAPSGINELGKAIIAHWDALRNFNPGDITNEETAIYSIRFWGFMKWSDILRRRLQGIPVFTIPIFYDADGVPLSDIEFMDASVRWHEIWHGFSPSSDQPVCTQLSVDQLNNPFAASQSTFGQYCTTNDLVSQFLQFHRELLHTYDAWRQRMGMPSVERWRPPTLQHFHPFSTAEGSLPEVDLSSDPATLEQQIKDEVSHFNSLDLLNQFAHGGLHSAGHGDVQSANGDISDPSTNNYSPRFMGWHKWIDYLWAIRQPRFQSFRLVTSDGVDYPRVLTVVHPTTPPDRVAPNNSLTGATAEGRGSLWVKYRVRPETWGRGINLRITAKVYRNSMDLTEVVGLDATTVTTNGVPQGVDSGEVEIRFDGLDADSQGAFAQQNLAGGAVGFKNGRIRMIGHLEPVGNIPNVTPVFGGANDQFYYDEPIDVILEKETRAPAVSVIFNKSSFSVDEVLVNASGSNQSSFVNSFFVVLQDPPEPAPSLGTSAIFADPSRTSVSGIFSILDEKPTVELVDEMGNSVTWFNLLAADVFKEQSTLPDNFSQRILFRYAVLFNDVNAFSNLLPNPADVRHAYLRIRARDRAGNVIQDQLSPSIKLFRDANPYMIDVQDQNPAWLSIDTRVFSVKRTEMKFNHRVSTSGSPEQYIKDVIIEFNNGTQDFDAIPADQNQSPLELMPQVGGEEVYNFALAKVRVRTQNPVADIRTFFRLFTTAVSNLSFNPTNYPTSTGVLPIALLGRTTPDSEITSIPFFADQRIETRDTFPGSASMESQTDPGNTQTFAASSPGGESIRYFGAYLDINSDTPRFPAAPVGNGPFSASECVSIRNIIRGQHQCMVAEVFYGGDPTEPGSTPAASDNLAQRNLLIIETANPGTSVSRTVQHSFDIVLANKRERDFALGLLRVQKVEVSRFKLKEASRARKRLAFTAATLVTNNAFNSPSIMSALQQPELARLTHIGLDEMLFFWNNLPKGSQVELYFPTLEADYVIALRRFRGAPNTVRLVDEHTLSLDVEEVTFLPIPPIGRERIEGLLTIRLPDDVTAGQLYSLDVLQVRPWTSTTLGGFRLTIAVAKAATLYEREARILAVFEERLKNTSPQTRWHTILVKQVEYFRERVQAFAQEAAEECIQTPTPGKGARIRLILEKVRILDYFGPLVHGSGRVSLISRVTTAADGTTGAITRLPSTGAYTVPNRPDGYTIEIQREIFRGGVKDNLTVEIFSAESEEAKHECYYKRVFKGKVEGWLGLCKPSDQVKDPENVGDWQVWYRIEKI